MPLWINYNWKYYFYNAEDMLDRSQVSDGITIFEYSSNGYRYFKKENSNYPEYYVYDPNGKLQAIAAAATLSMADGSSLSVMFPTNQYIWGPDRVLAQLDILNNKTYYYFYNGHGDVVQVTDTEGNIKNSYDYDVWGNFIQKEETVHNPFTYFGQTYDEATGLYYLRARYYAPSTGRFTQQDPAEDGYNWYVYGHQNPAMYIDENGENANYLWRIMLDKNLHKAVWYIGAETYLKDRQYYTSAWMLEHSLNEKPENVYRFGDSRIANLIKEDAAFLSGLDSAISNSNGITLDDSISVIFTNGDLYYSIHRCNIKLNGYKNNQGRWIINGFLDDKYDYTEIMSWMNGNRATLGTIANDAAVISQIIGAINPYHIYVYFNVY